MNGVAQRLANDLRFTNRETIDEYMYVYIDICAYICKPGFE